MGKEVEDKISDGFEFDIHFYSDSGRRSLIEYIDAHAKKVAIGFLEYYIRQYKLMDEKKISEHRSVFDEISEKSYQQYLNHLQSLKQ